MWLRSKIFRFFLIALVVLAVTNKIALHFFLFWTVPWIDIPMHMLGGVVVAFGFLMVFRGYVSGGFARGLITTIVVVFSIGVSWEVFELSGGITDLTDFWYVFDTIQDLAMDILGGFLGYVCARMNTLAMHKESTLA